MSTSTSTLSPAHVKIVQEFVHEVFDPRLRLAIDHQKFASQNLQSQCQRAQEWLRFYAREAIQRLRPRPPFDTTFPEVLKLMADSSQVYNDRFAVKVDSKRHLCQCCINLPNSHQCFHTDSVDLIFGNGKGNDNVVRCNTFRRAM